MMEHRNLLTYDKIYSVEDLELVCNSIKQGFVLTSPKNKVSYYNVPASFDIETSSFFQLVEDEEEKRAIMYVWSFCLDGYVFMGRTWAQFLKLVYGLVEYLGIDIGHRLIIYVHNLAFDFSFFRKWLEWLKVFSLDNRKPVYALTVDGIEFRCSYILTGYSLEKISSHLSIKKLVGDLDYKLLRHSTTVLTEEEKQYCVNDVKVVVEEIRRHIKINGDISKIPLTKTGYVRQFCRNNCFYENGIYNKNSAKELKYKNIIHRLNVSEEEYYQLKRAFQGGFTHANPFYVGEVIENVSSYDFTSSYPAVIVSEKFPMASSELLNEIDKETFEYSINNYCCLFELELFDVEPLIVYDNYLSRYRCREYSVKDSVFNNGRIVRTSHLKTTITEQDYFIIRRFYKWSKMKVANFRRYKRGYLPTDFIKAVLKLYSDKTKLKGVPEKEVEYMQSKEMINSCYGMMVTDIIRDEITYYDNMWETEPGRKDEEKSPMDVEKEINKYNRNKNRFLFYPWGVWVTAYARRNLFTGILEFNHDYVYSDTDSVKVINIENHTEYIERYNFEMRLKLLKAMDYHKLSYELIEPSTITGSKKLLGVWDYEGTYKRFKTLGAKRYMVEDEKGVNITVAGLNKKVTVPYILSKANNPFDFFTNDMEIPGEYTGKQTHTYLDQTMIGTVTDYRGVTSNYYELSGVHLCNGPYNMGLAQEFRDYILQIKHNYEGV